MIPFTTSLRWNAVECAGADNHAVVWAANRPYPTRTSELRCIAEPGGTWRAEVTCKATDGTTMFDWREALASDTAAKRWAVNREPVMAMAVRYVTEMAPMPADIRARVCALLSPDDG